jgi:hypothetical protein
MVIEGYAMDTVLARTLKMVETKGEAGAELAIAMTKCYIASGIGSIEQSAKKVIADVADGDMLKTQMSILRRLSKHDPYNVIALREQVAKRVLEQGKYVTV